MYSRFDWQTVQDFPKKGDAALREQDAHDAVQERCFPRSIGSNHRCDFARANPQIDLAVLETARGGLAVNVIEC